MKIEYISHKDPKYIFEVPPLVLPNREPDFTMEHNDKEYPKWSNITRFFIEERVMAFNSVESPELELIRIMIDERYGIYADETAKQDKSRWVLQCTSTHQAYINWVISKNLLE